MSADTIVRVAARGDGITADGRHAAFAAPGDRLLADGSVEPGPHHAVPPCRHFPTCGGCQLQHLDDESWAQFLTDRVAGALEAQGLSAEVRPPALSPPKSRRRATLHADRHDGRVRIGFSEAKSHALIDLAECHVLRPELFALVAPLRRLLGGLAWKGRATIDLTLVDQGVDVLLTGVAAADLRSAEALTAFAQSNGVARLSLDPGFGVETRWEPVGATVTLGGIPVGYPPASFLQATEEGEAALVAAARAATQGAAIVADLFAGLGTFAFALPGKVYAAEAARDAILSLKAAAGRAGRPIFTEHRDLFRRPLTTAELDRFGAIVLDPPRAGAREQIAQLASARPPICYISCNPSTFARDAKTLIEGGYRLEWVQPVGQFRWSTHVELASRFSR